MNSIGKTTKNNPAAFQKALPLKLLTVIKKTIRRLINGQIKASIFFLLAELLNYLSSYKRKFQFYCNLCNCESPYFLHTSNESKILYNSICPNCSSRKRHRGLYEVYKNLLKEFESPKILHFSPEPVYYNLFQPFDYITADLELTDVDLQLNIEDIEYKSNSFDIILCNHVLEHVKYDNKALKEIYRILKPCGVAILSVPGNWSRDNIIEYDYPDGNGHYRDYGLNFLSVLDDIFTVIQSIDLYKYNGDYNLPIGLTPLHDLIFLCQKK